jgi:hypothetical protein
MLGRKPPDRPAAAVRRARDNGQTGASLNRLTVLSDHAKIEGKLDDEPGSAEKCGRRVYLVADTRG